MVDLNATQAAIRAGYSEKTATKIASENLTKPDIQKYIEQLQEDARTKTKLQTEDVISELCSIGFAEIDLSKIKPADKIKALENIAKLLGFDAHSEDEMLSRLDKVLNLIPSDWS